MSPSMPIATLSSSSPSWAAPLAAENERISGSRAQHDLIEFTLLRAYLEADRAEEAQQLLSARRPGASGVPVAGLAPAH